MPRAPARARLALLAASLVAIGGASDGSDDDVHTIFSAQCAPIFDWQSLGLFESHARSGMPGGITRLLACSAEALAQYRGMDIGPTFVHDSLEGAAEGEAYPALNKPHAAAVWTRARLEEEAAGGRRLETFIVFLDADMLLREPVRPSAFGARRGRVGAAAYDFLVGAEPGAKLVSLFDVPNPRLLAKVGGVHIFHRDDLARVAPRWLAWTVAVRRFACEQPEAYARLAMREGLGAPDAARRQFLWQCEMYGYCFAAAEAGLEHQVTYELMIYVGYEPARPDAPPPVLHYGSDYKLGDAFSFNKMTLVDLRPSECVRWQWHNLPPPSALETAPRNRAEVRRAARAGLIRYHITTLNAAACAYHRRHCTAQPPLPCAPEHAPAECADKVDACEPWAQGGECQKNPVFMRANCPSACGACAVGNGDSLFGPARCRDLANATFCAAAAREGGCELAPGALGGTALELCHRSCGLCERGRSNNTHEHHCPAGAAASGSAAAAQSRESALNMAVAKAAARRWRPAPPTAAQRADDATSEQLPRRPAAAAAAARGADGPEAGARGRGALVREAARGGDGRRELAELAHAVGIAGALQLVALVGVAALGLGTLIARARRRRGRQRAPSAPSRSRSGARAGRGGAEEI